MVEEDKEHEQRERGTLNSTEAEGVGCATKSQKKSITSDNVFDSAFLQIRCISFSTLSRLRSSSHRNAAVAQSTLHKLNSIPRSLHVSTRVTGIFGSSALSYSIKSRSSFAKLPIELAPLPRSRETKSLSIPLS